MRINIYNKFIFPIKKLLFIIKLMKAFLLGKVRWLTIYDDSPAYKELKDWISNAKIPKYGI